MHAVYFVSREGNCVFVKGKLNTQAFLWVVAKINEAKQKGYYDFVLDLTECETVYPEGLVPLAAFADQLRANGAEIDLVLPNNEPLERLLINCNFAHFVRPDIYDYKQVILPKHVSIRRFSSLSEQVQFVKECVNVTLNNSQMPRDVLQGMEWSLNELMDNVLIHAQSARGGFALASTFQDHVSFTVADCGRGILASLREGYPALTRDIDAIGEAVKAGVTRDPSVGQGNGMAGSLKIATDSGGGITITSGRGSLHAFKRGAHTDSRGVIGLRFQSFQGTIVSAQIMKNADFKVSEALGFTNMIGGVVDVIETDYETNDGMAFAVSMKKEAPGFGNREAGKQIRNKLANLLSANKTKALVLDWEGVPLISSSFADECLGKLFVEMGPLEFSSRIRNVNMVSLVRRLVDKAILQRSAQVVESDRKTSAASQRAIEITESDEDQEQ